MIINIPNIGNVNFPDSMSENDINIAAKKLYTDSLSTKQPATVQQTQQQESWLDKLKGTPSWMQSKPGQGWDDANAQAAGGDVTNPMAYLSEAQKTEQTAAEKALGKAVNVAVREGAGYAKGAVINPVSAVLQATSGQAGQQFAQEAEKAYQQQRKTAGGEGFDYSQLGGAIISPVNKVLPGGAAAAGAVGAMLQPVEGENLGTFDVLYGKIKQATTGAVLGRVAENLISSLTPKLKEGAKELMDKGIPVSPGQAYEGAPGWLFRQMESFGLGPKASDVNKAFNNSVSNEVLSSIDQTLPKNIPAGQASVRVVQNKISNFYDDSLSKLGDNVFDSSYKTGMNDILKQASQDIPADAHKRLINSLNANIGRRMQNGKVSGENLKDIQIWLKDEVAKWDKGTDVTSVGLKTAYSDVLANINQFISRIDKSGNIAKADAAWAKLYSFADASKRASTTGGVFSPEQLAQAATSQATGTLAAGGGRAPLSDVAQQALGILGKQEPRTALGKIMLASKAATGAATAIAAPAIALPILTASGMTYAAARELMKNPTATRLAIKQALEKNAGLFGAAGQNLLNQLNREE